MTIIGRTKVAQNASRFLTALSKLERGPLTGEIAQLQVRISRCDEQASYASPELGSSRIH